MCVSTIFRSLSCKAFVIVLCSMVLSSTASAGIITGVQLFGTQAGTGSGMGDVSVPVILTVNPDNDNQTGGGPLDNDIIVPIKRFDKPGEIDMVFQVSNSNGVTEYKFFESVDNNTGINWSKYTMELGTGIGAGFVPSIAGDWLGFDAPFFDTLPVSSAFSNVSTSEDVLVFSNGIQGTGSETYQFRIDVGNLPAGQNFTFTLRQTPLQVPEPGSCLLLLGALAGILIYRKHRS